MVIIGIIIGLVILLLTIFASSDGDKINLNPMRAKVEPKESAVLCKLEKEMKELSQHCDSLFLKTGKETRSFKDVMNCLFRALRAHGIDLI